MTKLYSHGQDQLQHSLDVILLVRRDTVLVSHQIYNARNSEIKMLESLAWGDLKSPFPFSAPVLPFLFLSSTLYNICLFLYPALCKSFGLQHKRRSNKSARKTAQRETCNFFYFLIFFRQHSLCLPDTACSTQHLPPPKLIKVTVHQVSFELNGALSSSSRKLRDTINSHCDIFQI